MQNRLADKADVVIVGAGLAGLECARLLALRGHRVILADRKTDLTKGVHTTGIFVRKTFEDFAFPAGTLGPPIRDVSLYSPSLRRLDLRSERDEFRVGNMPLLYSIRLKECIAAGCHFLPGARYISTEPSANGVTVRLERAGEALLVAARVLVGADGARSRVARDLKLDENRSFLVGYEELFPSAGAEPRLHCFLDSQLAPGYLAWIADDGCEVHVGVGGYAERFDPRRALEQFKAKTQHVFASDDLRPASSRGGLIPVGGVLRRIANRRGLLIGDAAGAVSPLTAGGLDPCLRLSAFAAAVIDRRLAEDNAAVLESYSGEAFRARFISRLWMRKAISALSSKSLTEAAFLLLKTPAGRKFAKHVFFGRGSFPDVDCSLSAVASRSEKIATHSII
jgi:flavin-dependent dehydrogenase